MVPLDAADLTQEFYLRKLEGKSRCQSIGQFVIDYLRKSTGRKGQPGYDERRARRFEYVELTDIAITESTNNTLFANASENPRNYNGVFKRFKELELAGYNLKEIGKALGVTESRASQRGKEIRIKAEKIDLLEELKISSQTFYFCVSNLK
jgi:DNA-directed RNA polymerase specialized sigma24 family protein